MRNLVLVVCTFIVGCGGSVAQPIGDAGPDSPLGNDGSVNDGGVTGKCPANVPQNGAPCSPEGFSCEYGSSQLTMCNVIARCESGAWSIPVPPPGPPPPECTDKNSPKCPSTFASVPVGKSCSADYPTHCNYPEGECACTVDMGGPFPLDAAAVAKWYCGKPQNPICPVPRPKIGSPCSAPASVQCDYGACVLPGGTVLQCEGGYWQETPWACPG